MKLSSRRGRVGASGRDEHGDGENIPSGELLGVCKADVVWYSCNVAINHAL